MDNESLRKQLLNIVSSSNDNENSVLLQDFLTGEKELSRNEIENAINNINNQNNNLTLKEQNILQQHIDNGSKFLSDDIYNLSDINIDKLEEALHDANIAKKYSDGRSGKITNITNNTNNHAITFNNDDVFKFSNGTSETRALQFISEGKGYTRLETPTFISENNNISREGLQISLQGELDYRSSDYAIKQGKKYGDRPVIIEGEIPAQYVFDNYNHEGEYSIPKEYYDKISNATIKDAETGTLLYSLDNGKVNKLETYTDYNYPELKIKETNNELITNKKITSKEANQIVDQVKNILTPPNWENEGKNESLNKEYKTLLDKYFGSYIDDLDNPKYTDAAILKFATKDEGYQAAFNIFKGGKYEDAVSDKNNIGLNLIKNNENVILEIHGSKEGKVVYGNYDFKTNELIQRLEDTGLIPKGTKQIYTMSCYGGLQEKGLTTSGIPFESSHTSLKPTIGYGNYDIFDDLDNSSKEFYQYQVDFDKSQIEDYTKYLEEAKEELNTLKNEHPDWTDLIQDEEEYIKEYKKEIDFYKKQLTDNEKKLQEHIDEITKSNKKKLAIVNLTESGNTTDKYKQDVLDSFKKYGDDFAKAEFIAEPKEIENALWYLISPEERKRKLENIEFHEKLIKNYKEYTQYEKSDIASYEESLQKAKESNDIKDIEKYTERIKNSRENIKRYKKNIKEYSTIVDKNKLQLQEFDKKDELYGKDYKAKSNFVSNQKRYLSSKEAFEKYSLDSDEFYTSQGLNPKEQRNIINELNSKRKPKLSDEEILNQLHKETEEAANQFYKTAEEANQIIKEANQIIEANHITKEYNFTEEHNNLLKDILQPDPYSKTIKEYTGSVNYYDVETQREYAYKPIKERVSDQNPKISKKINKIDVNKEAEPITIRYHRNKEHIFAIDNTKLGNDIKIKSFGDNFGHTGTWSSPRIIPGQETAWLMNNHDWIITDDNGKYEGYISVFKFKDDAKILKISNEDDLINLIENFGTNESKKDIISLLDNVDDDTKLSLKQKDVFSYNLKKDELVNDINKKIKINWDEASKQYDAVRIRTPSFFSSSDVPYSLILSEYYGDTDVIFNKESVDVLKTMSIDQYYKNLEQELKTGEFTDYENKPKPEKHIQKPSKPKQEIKKPESKIPENIDFNNILEDTAKETAKQNNELTNKTIKNTAKKALNTKTLGIAAIGATVAAAGIAGILSYNKNKRKHKKENKYTYSDDNYYMNHNQDLEYANNITRFSTGHSTYNLT